MALVAITNNEDWCKVYDHRDMQLSFDLETGTGTLFSTIEDLVLPPECVLVHIKERQDVEYRALIGAKIGLPYPTDDVLLRFLPEEWYDYVLTFEDHQWGTVLDDWAGLQEAVQEFTAQHSK